MPKKAGKKKKGKKSGKKKAGSADAEVTSHKGFRPGGMPLIACLTSGVKHPIAELRYAPVKDLKKRISEVISIPLEQLMLFVRATVGPTVSELEGYRSTWAWQADMHLEEMMDEQLLATYSLDDHQPIYTVIRLPNVVLSSPFQHSGGPAEPLTSSVQSARSKQPNIVFQNTALRA